MHNEWPQFESGTKEQNPIRHLCFLFMELLFLVLCMAKAVNNALLHSIYTVGRTNKTG